MIWNWLKRRYTADMELDSEQIQKQLRRLNKGLKVPVWFPVDLDYYALTAVQVDPDGKTEFFPGKGLPGKVFINEKTGEMRIFHINAFKVDSGK